LIVSRNERLRRFFLFSEVDNQIIFCKFEPTAVKISENLSDWHTNTQAESDQASLRFVLTIFSTTNVDTQNPLPLVQFPGLVIPVGGAGWW